MHHPSIKNVSLFGSTTRNDQDHLSDIDVIVIVTDGMGTVPETEVFHLIPQVNQSKISITWYGFQKLQMMFAEGHLFSWHLFQESTPVGDWKSIAEIMGKPQNYDTAIEDIDGLIDLLNSSNMQLLQASPNSTYELGLIYLCARNIAMSASWHLSPKPNFGRLSPYEISNPTFPVTHAEYEILTKCRMASQRGLSFSYKMSNLEAIAICDKILTWSTKIREKIING